MRSCCRTLNSWFHHQSLDGIYKPFTRKPRHNICLSRIESARVLYLILCLLTSHAHSLISLLERSKNKGVGQGCQRENRFRLRFYFINFACYKALLPWIRLGKVYICIKHLSFYAYSLMRTRIRRRPIVKGLFYSGAFRSCEIK